MSIELVEQELAERLKGTLWGSPEMAGVINIYLGSLLRKAGVGMALALTPLSVDIEGVDFPGAVLRLGLIQGLSQSERQGLFRRAWVAGNGAEPTGGEHGYKNWLTEVLLEGAHRLRRPLT